jgi:hypothetical protein
MKGNTIMNNNDERDHAEEAYNQELLHTGDGEGPAGEEALPPMTNERIYGDLKAYADAGMIDYVLPTEPLGEQWIVGWQNQILWFVTTEGIIGFLVGIQVATVHIARLRGIDVSSVVQAARTVDYTE